jgi:hypothetical protein
MKNPKRKKKITDFDFEAFERGVEKRLYDLDYQGKLQNTLIEFEGDVAYRSIIEDKKNKIKNN